MSPANNSAARMPASTKTRQQKQGLSASGQFQIIDADIDRLASSRHYRGGIWSDKFTPVPFRDTMQRKASPLAIRRVQRYIRLFAPS